MKNITQSLFTTPFFRQKDRNVFRRIVFSKQNTKYKKTQVAFRPNFLKHKRQLNKIKCYLQVGQAR